MAMIDRRTILTTALATIAGGASTRSALAQPAVSRITAYAFSFPALAGGDIRLAEYASHPLLVVNTASLCGYTPQYGGLQELWFHDRGFVIVGVPSNDFGGQEPGGSTEIAATAQQHYGVPFRSQQKPLSKARMRIRSTDGQPKCGRAMCHAGTSTSI
jgi:glutathione peroxidase